MSRVVRFSFILLLLFVGPRAWSAGQICGEGAQDCFAGEVCRGGTCQPEISPREGNGGGGSTGGGSTPSCCRSVAIAYSVSTGKIGYGLAESLSHSRARSVRECNRAKDGRRKTTDCAVAVSTSDGCVALAWDPKAPKDQIGVGSSNTVSAARKIAIRDCRTKGCVVGPWACSAGH